MLGRSQNLADGLETVIRRVSGKGKRKGVPSGRGNPKVGFPRERDRRGRPIVGHAALGNPHDFPKARATSRVSPSNDSPDAVPSCGDQALPSATGFSERVPPGWRIVIAWLDVPAERGNACAQVSVHTSPSVQVLSNIDDKIPRRPYTATGGALLAASPVPVAAVTWAHGDLGTLPAWLTLLAGAAAFALFAAGLGMSARPQPARALATAGCLACPVLAWPGIGDSPARTLVVALVLIVVLAGLWRVGTPLFTPLVRRADAVAGMVRSSAATALLFWLALAIGSDRLRPAAMAAVGVSLVFAAALGARWLWRRRSTPDVRTRAVGIALLATLLLAATTYRDAWALVSCGAIYALLAAMFGPRPDRIDPTEGWSATLFEHPERLLVSTFATLALLGTIVLALPQSSTSGAGIGGMDAAFTAISAVCVTGLVVRDTPAEFTALGQITLLLLMQLGGLGIMTFSTAALRVLGRRLSIRQESAVALVIGAKDRSRLIASAQDVLRVTFITEAIGAGLLGALFLAHGDPLGTAAWRGVFTAVSAFCNAGFALQTDSLVPYCHDPLILHTVATLIVLGGLSPVTVLAVAGKRRGPGPWPAQVTIGLLAAIVLLVSGCVFFLIAEWDHSLRGLDLVDKLHNAWFQSATLRTAGFNSVDLASVHPATWLMMLTFMFVGASPGGTAGGVKTTTVAVLLLSVVDTIRGAAHTAVLGRRIPDRTVQRAAVVVTIAVAAAGLALTGLLLTQRIPLPMAAFEVVSALGTVGLSQGATAMLDDVGKLIIIVCMFIGRIGGLTLMMFMSQRVVTGRVTLPSEDIDVG